jgi:serine protease Do
MGDSRAAGYLVIVALFTLVLVLQVALVLGYHFLPPVQNQAVVTAAAAVAAADAVPAAAQGDVPGSGGEIWLTSCSTEDLGVAVARVRAAVVYITGPRSTTKAGSTTTAAQVTAMGDRMGSGIIFDEQGYVLTNYHVIADMTDIHVSTFADRGVNYAAELIATSPADDLAILRIAGPRPFPVATFGNSDMLEAGDEVLAVGCPFNMEQSVTHGITSDTSRSVTIDGRMYRDLIQTDAAINSGNSGGALINTEGEVVGVNVAIYAPNQVFCGVGFAIPINRAKLLMMKTQYHSTPS